MNKLERILMIIMLTLLTIGISSCGTSGIDSVKRTMSVESYGTIDTSYLDGAWYAEGSTMDDEVLVNDYVKQWFYDSFAEHYIIDDYQVVISNLDTHIDHVSADIAIMAMTTLNYSSVEEVPYMRGLRNALNISTFAEIVPADYANSLSEYAKMELTKSVALAKSLNTKTAQNRLEVDNLSSESILSYDSATANVLASASQIMSKTQAANLVQMIADKFVDVAECIDRSAVLSMDLKFAAKINHRELYDVTIDLIYPDELIEVGDKLLDSSDALFASAATDINAFLKSEASNRSSTTTRGYSSYDRLVARNYAWMYTEPGYGYNNGPSPTYGEGYSAVGGYNTAYWNLTLYKCTAAGINHDGSQKDCACFVSQCLKYGGIPTAASTWEFPNAAGMTYAWQSVSALETYMLTTKGYWNTATRSTCNAGNVIKTSSSHIVLCTYNDTVTGRYTGHTNDRNNLYYKISDTGWTFYTINTK